MSTHDLCRLLEDVADKSIAPDAAYRLIEDEIHFSLDGAIGTLELTTEDE